MRVPLSWLRDYVDVELTAEALGVSTRTVERDWKRARAWLRQAIDGS